MNRTRLAALVLALLPLAAVHAGDAAPAPRPVATAVEKTPAGSKAKPRLAAWREGARPPAEVPPAAIVRAAKRDGASASGRRSSVRAVAKMEPVEIVWDAPNSSR